MVQALSIRRILLLSLLLLGLASLRLLLSGLLMPGMVNAHSHAPMVLFRGQGGADRG